MFSPLSETMTVMALRRKRNVVNHLQKKREWRDVACALSATKACCGSPESPSSLVPCVAAYMARAAHATWPGPQRLRPVAMYNMNRDRNLCGPGNVALVAHMARAANATRPGDAKIAPCSQPCKKSSHVSDAQCLIVLGI